MRHFRLLFFGIALVLGVAIAVSNRQWTPLRLEPFPFQIELPLYVIAFAFFLAGILFGGFVIWWRGGTVRKRARRAETRAGALQKKLADDAGEAAAPAPASIPAPAPAQPPARLAADS